MKKTYALLFVLFFIFSSNGQSQHLYCGFGGGYGVGTNKTDDFDDVKINYYSSADVYQYKSLPTSLGTGYNECVYVGYLFRNNIGLELGAFFFKALV